MIRTMRDIMPCIILFQAVVFYCIQASNEHTEKPINTLSIPEETKPEGIPADKDESFSYCDIFDVQPAGYVLFSNGTAYVKDYNKTYTEQFYYLDGDILVVCKPCDDMVETSNPHSKESNYIRLMRLLESIGIHASMVCLVIHLIVFAMLPDLRNLPGCNLATMCFSLFLSYLLTIVSRTKYLIHNRMACVTVAGMMQFFYLASFLWMFVISFTVFRSIRQATSNLRGSLKVFKAMKYLCNSLVAWGTSLAFTTAAMIVDNVEGVNETFKPQFHKFCRFRSKESLLIFFAGPVLTLISVNFILFGISAYIIFVNRMRSSQDSQQTNLIKSEIIYFRLVVIMGVTWFTDIFAPFVNACWLRYLISALNTFQGFFIFLAFTCTGKVKNHLMNKLFGGRKISK